ncbi:MAG: M23 family metallopeptidase [Oxalobacter sp.]|nr:MAG: M23 family metallopeptidase [Oxalobacter sp.]
MQVILLHPRFTQAKSLTLTTKHIFFGAALFMMSVASCAALMLYLLLAFATTHRVPVLNEMFASIAQDEAGIQVRQAKENLAVMTKRMGEMQAQIMRLDALGERVQGLAGVKPEEFNFKEKPGRGGTAKSAVKEKEVTVAEFSELVDKMESDIQKRADYMNAVESSLVGLKIKARVLPTIHPVKGGYISSSFGKRFDPFTGDHSRHEGTDFVAPHGTHIIAAAGGVVVMAEYNGEYGNMIEIDHGNEIVTRYAHAARVHVTVGDIVKRGQHIADVGTTGRSTGPHLHFEVRVKGVAQNSIKFLAAGANYAEAKGL